jgi:hypothetical protein
MQEKKTLRCQHPTLGEPKCRRKACWSVAGYFDGRLQFSINLCARHFEQWKERMQKAEMKGDWEFEVQKLA